MQVQRFAWIDLARAITHCTSQKAELFCEIRMMRQSAVWIAENAMDAYDCCLFPRLLTQLQGALRKKSKFAHRHSFDRLPPSICVMCKSDQATTSITSTDADLATVTCQDPTRRALILTALATGACMASSRSSVAEEDLPGSNERPQKADVLVFSEGERAGEVIKPQDLQVGGPPVRAWPKDPKTSVVRKGSRLNEVLVVRLDPAELDEETRSRAAGGVVAYSIICVHTGCPITAWVKAASGDKDVFKCVCHNSEYDPRQSGQVIFGPAPRRLPALPLAAEDGPLAVAATFVGKVGAQQTR